MVEKLFEAITAKNEYLVDLINTFGSDYWYVEKETLVINGMKDAFEIVAGQSYTDYLIAQTNRALAKAS